MTPSIDLSRQVEQKVISNIQSSWMVVRNASTRDIELCARIDVNHTWKIAKKVSLVLKIETLSRPMAHI